MKRINVIPILLFALFQFKASAQFQLKGGELTITEVSGLNFEARVSLLVNWPAVATKSFVNIDWGDGSPIQALPYTGSNCTWNTASSLDFGGYHNYSYNGSFTATVRDSFFIPGIVNIPNSETQRILLRQVITTTPSVFNSPLVVGSPGCLDIGEGCHSTDVSIGPDYTDWQGDSLSFDIVDHPEIPGYVIPPAVVSKQGVLSFSTNVSPGYYNICLKVSEWRLQVNPPVRVGSNFRDFILKIDNCTGLTENINLLDQIMIYPNPAHDTFYLETKNESVHDYQIFNSMGQNVMSDRTTSYKTEINIKELSNGLYYLKVNDNGNSRVIKIIKE